MPISLYDALVPSYLQILRGSLGWLDKAAAFAEAQGKSEAEMMDARLAPDMLPLNRQVRGFAMHAQCGIAGAVGGLFSPEMTPPPASFAGLKARVGEAIDPDALDDLIGKPMRFELGETKLPFAADQFLLSFSQPNFYFHVSTAYGILRNMGVDLGKRDYLAGLRTAH